MLWDSCRGSRAQELLQFRPNVILGDLGVQVEKTVHAPGLGEDVGRVTELTGLLIPSVIANYVDRSSCWSEDTGLNALIKIATVIAM